MHKQVDYFIVNFIVKILCLMNIWKFSGAQWRSDDHELRTYKHHVHALKGNSDYRMKL